MTSENKEKPKHNKAHGDEIKKGGKPKNKGLSLIDKEQKLIDKIEKAKDELSKIQNKRRNEIANLAFKHKLHHLDNETLEAGFQEVYEAAIKKQES
jgi:hypothetical protein